MNGSTKLRVVLGVFAGGHATRMGGRDKALLLAPEGGETLLARSLRLGRELDFDCVVLGGPARDGVLVVADAPAGIGPLGGLSALLAHAGDRPAVALACDMPFVSAELLARLATTDSEAPVLAPRDAESGKWQPLCARYRPSVAGPALARAIAADVRSFQAFLSMLPVRELVLSEQERALLADWDDPASMELRRPPHDP